MAVAFDRKLGETNTVVSTAITLSSVSLTAGEFVVLWVAADNTGSNVPTISNVTFASTGQTYSVVASHGSASASASAATVGHIIVIPSVSTTTTGNLVVTFSASPSKAVMLAAVFTGVDNTVTAGPDSVTSPITATGFSGSAVGNLILVMTSCENNSAMTKDSDTTGGSWVEPDGDGAVFTTGGGAAANVSMMAAYKILTATGTQLWNATGHANDGGACSVELEATASGTNLVVADGAHSHSAETPTLTQVHSVAVADGAHAHAADQVALSQNSNLVIADSSHSHAADNVALTIVTDLVVADGAHAHAADSVTVTQAHSVTVADSTHGHTAEVPTLTQVHVLVIGDSSHAVTSDEVALATGGTSLVIADATHGHTADGVVLTQLHVVVIADGTHGHTADQVALTQNSDLVVADSTHAHTADTVTVTEDDTNSDLVIADALHGHTADLVTVTTEYALVIEDSAHTVTSDTVRLRAFRRRWIFRPPTVEERLVFMSGRPQPWSVARGITVMKVDGTYVEVRWPTDAEIEAATVVYRGGFEHDLNDDEITDLTAAGYGDYLHEDFVAV
jgi:hypothetical protein